MLHSSSRHAFNVRSTTTRFIALILIVSPVFADEFPRNITLHLEERDQSARTATLSLPLSEETANTAYANNASPTYRVNGHVAHARPIAWWSRNRIPRRVMLSVSTDAPLGASPTVSIDAGQADKAGSSPWRVESRAFAKNDWRPYKVVLRGGSHAESFSQFDDLVLTYKDRAIPIRLGTRREKFHDSAATSNQHDWWQWTIAETLVDTAELKLVRVGGLLYNEDTFEQCDVLLELFGNGVVRVSAHFVNARVIGDGWEYFGIPVIAFGHALAPEAPVALDGAQTTFALGPGLLDITDSIDMTSKEFPGRLYAHEGLFVYQPWKDQRVTDKVQTMHKPFVVDVGEGTIPRGMARTVRFTVSLSDAPPRVARMQAPAWMYAMGGDLWKGDFLPAQWRYAQTIHGIASNVAKPDARYHGTFEAGYSDAASEGMGGTTLIYSGMHSGDPFHVRRGIDYTYAWADMMVDHVDFSVRQPFTGYYWKTISYYKFNDLVWGYLETGDPYLLETAEHCANAYYAMFRSLWPIRSIGRGLWPAQGMIDLYAYTRDPHYLECALDLCKKAMVTYQDPNQLPGHQMGVGPNGIGNINEPGMQGFAELVLAHTVLQIAMHGESDIFVPGERERVLAFAAQVVDLVQSSLRTKGANAPGGWREYETGMLIQTMAPLAREEGRVQRITELEEWTARVEQYLAGESSGRPYHAVTGRARYDALTIGARWVDGTVAVDSTYLPEAADGKTVQVETPLGPVRFQLKRDNTGKWTTSKVKGAIDTVVIH